MFLPGSRESLCAGTLKRPRPDWEKELERPGKASNDCETRAGPELLYWQTCEFCFETTPASDRDRNPESFIDCLNVCFRCKTALQKSSLAPVFTKM